MRKVWWTQKYDFDGCKSEMNAQLYLAFYKFAWCSIIFMKKKNSWDEQIFSAIRNSVKTE